MLIMNIYSLETIHMPKIFFVAMEHDFTFIGCTLSANRYFFLIHNDLTYESNFTILTIFITLTAMLASYFLRDEDDRLNSKMVRTFCMTCECSCPHS